MTLRCMIFCCANTTHHTHRPSCAGGYRAGARGLEHFSPCTSLHLRVASRSPGRPCPVPLGTPAADAGVRREATSVLSERAVEQMKEQAAWALLGRSEGSAHWPLIPSRSPGCWARSSCIARGPHAPPPDSVAQSGCGLLASGDGLLPWDPAGWDRRDRRCGFGPPCPPAGGPALPAESIFAPTPSTPLLWAALIIVQDNRICWG